MDNHLNLNLFNCLVLAGIIQGIVFTVVVASSRKYRQFATMVLAAFILSFSLDNFQFFLEDAGVVSEYELMAKYFIPFQFLSGPLFLLYGLSLINPDRNWKNTDKWFFIPFFIALGISSVYKFFALSETGPATTAIFYHLMEKLFELASILIDFSVLIYLTIKVFRFPQANNTRLKWFKNVLVSLIILTLLWIYVTYRDFYLGTENWYTVYIGMSAIIYWMGHIGIYHFGNQLATRKKPENRLNYAAIHIDALKKMIVEEKRYLDPNLSLDAIAAELNLSKSYLSRLINSELKMSFPDYLNSIRVEEAKNYLQSTDYANYTLVAIGLEAGFNSKTTFNHAFKKNTQQTPSEFRKLHLKRPENCELQ